MSFVGDFVLELGRKCVEVVHRYGKGAFVFYDDSWIGLEPYSGRFTEFGFDGLIKAVFSGYEARLCAGADVPTHELRLHPYLFPVDLQGRPTFSPGGDPVKDASRYWVNVRRALLRAKIDRIGLGGYLSLVEPFADFQDYIGQVADEHRLIRSLHAAGGPQMAPTRVAILTAWGALRTWTCSGHMHEHPELILTQVLESLSGLPFEVTFLDFDQIETHGVPDDVDVLVNAGLAGSAWSGGDNWRRSEVVTAITAWVATGGGLVGVGQPSATDRSTQYFQLAAVLGVDQDIGDRECLNRRSFALVDHPVIDGVDGADLPLQRGVFLTCDDSDVFAAIGGTPVGVASRFAEGRSVYLSGHTHGPAAARRLDNAIRWAGRAGPADHRTSNPLTEVAYYPASRTFLVVNDSQEEQVTEVRAPDGVVASVRLPAGGMTALKL